MSPPHPETAVPLSWTGHVRATLGIGLPLIGAQLAQQAITITDTVMLGWLGAAPLAAGVLGTTLFFVAFVFASGFAHAVMPLASEAAANGYDRSLRRSVRMGLWVVALVVSSVMPALWWSGPILRAIGQEPELAALAQDYMRIAQWSLYPAVSVMVLRSCLAALARTQVVLWATVAGALLNALLNWMLIFGNWGAPSLGIRGAAIATLGTHTLVLAVVAAYVVLTPALRRYEIFVRPLRPDWDAFRTVWKLGLPISATLLAEVGLFGSSSLMMGWIGTVPLAAHGIALQIISALFMIPYGLSAAGTVRVGHALGRRDPVGLDRAGKTVLALSVAFALFGAALIWIAPRTLIGLFLSDTEPEAEAILHTGSVLLAVAAVFQLADTLQVVSVGLLRGLRDTRVPMAIAIFSYWGLGLPSAYLLGFTFGFAGAGVWAGLAIGLAVAATLLTARFLRRDRLDLVRYAPPAGA